MAHLSSNFKYRVFAPKRETVLCTLYSSHTGCMLETVLAQSQGLGIETLSKGFLESLSVDDSKHLTCEGLLDVV